MFEAASRLDERGVRMKITNPKHNFSRLCIDLRCGDTSFR
jgi:hypothetical protein